MFFIIVLDPKGKKPQSHSLVLPEADTAGYIVDCK